MIAENLSPQQTKAERWIVWVYVWLFVSVVITVPGRTIILRATSGDSSRPAWSPTSREIALVSNRGGTPGLYVVNADTGQARRLANTQRTPENPYDTRAFAWSPDGRQIAFLSDPEGPDNIHLYIINADGSGMKRVARVTNSYEANEFPLAWSPDGKWIVFATGLYVTDPEGREVNRLAPGVGFIGERGLTWSPDSQYVAFTSWKDGIDTAVASVDGSRVLHVNGCSGPAWSPIGNRIACTWHGLVLLNPDGSEPRRLANDQGKDFSPFIAAPVWSPDGAQIALVAECEAHCGIYVVKADGSQVKRVASMQGIWQSPTWSPDGKQIAFRAGGGIYSINADGTGLRTIFAAQPVLPSVLAVLAPCLIHTILVLGLFSPYVYVRRHTQQAFVLVGLYILVVLMLALAGSWQAELGDEAEPALDTGLGFGVVLWLWGIVAGVRQVRRGDCLLMELAGEGKELPRPWAQAKPGAFIPVSAALPAVDEKMISQRATVGCKFYGWWVLANMLGWAAIWGTGVLAGLGAFLGALLLRKVQASVLREKLGEDAAQDFAKTSWLRAGFTLVGIVAVQFVLIQSVFWWSFDRLGPRNSAKLSMYNTAATLIIVSMIYLLGGFSTGMTQWCSVLRERFSHSKLWVMANSLGWGLGGLGGALVILNVSSIGNIITLVVMLVAQGLLVGAVIGAITGLALIRMFRHPLPPAPSEQTTQDSSRTMT